MCAASLLNFSLWKLTLSFWVSLSLFLPNDLTTPVETATSTSHVKLPGFGSWFWLPIPGSWYCRLREAWMVTLGVRHLPPTWELWVPACQHWSDACLLCCCLETEPANRKWLSQFLSVPFKINTLKKKIDSNNKLQCCCEDYKTIHLNYLRHAHSLNINSPFRTLIFIFVHL